MGQVKDIGYLDSDGWGGEKQTHLLVRTDGTVN
jgi:hypothetical protein